MANDPGSLTGKNRTAAAAVEYRAGTLTLIAWTPTYWLGLCRLG